LKDSIDDLVLLCADSANAALNFSEAIKAHAEKSGLLASVVRKFVIARAGEKFGEKKRECEQLSLLFEEVGE
jgi:hypothetical protein